MSPRDRRAEAGQDHPEFHNFPVPNDELDDCMDDPWLILRGFDEEELERRSEADFAKIVVRPIIRSLQSGMAFEEIVNAEKPFLRKYPKSIRRAKAIVLWWICFGHERFRALPREDWHVILDGTRSRWLLAVVRECFEEVLDAFFLNPFCTSVRIKFHACALARRSGLLGWGLPSSATSKTFRPYSEYLLTLIANISNLREFALTSSRLLPFPDANVLHEWESEKTWTKMVPPCHSHNELLRPLAKIPIWQGFDVGSSEWDAPLDADALLERLNPETCTDLNLSGRCPEGVPATIKRFHHLRRLDLGFNQLTTLPDAVAQLHSLTELYLDENRFSEIPAAIKDLPCLHTVDMSRNHIQSMLMEEYQWATCVWNLGLAGNPIVRGWPRLPLYQRDDGRRYSCCQESGYSGAPASLGDVIGSASRFIHDLVTTSPHVHEESITDLLHFKVSKSSRLLKTKVFTRHEEGRESGADMEWWFVDDRFGFGIRLQAKHIGPDASRNRSALNYRNGEQLERLIGDARDNELGAFYIFYTNHGGCCRCQRPWRTEGAFIASADEIRHDFLAKSGESGLRKPTESALVLDSLPITWLFDCPTTYAARTGGASAAQCVYETIQRCFYSERHRIGRVVGCIEYARPTLRESKVDEMPDYVLPILRGQEDVQLPKNVSDMKVFYFSSS